MTHTHHNIRGLLAISTALKMCVFKKKTGKPGTPNRQSIKIVNIPRLRDLFGEQNVCMCTHAAGRGFAQCRVRVQGETVASIVLRHGKLEKLTDFSGLDCGEGVKLPYLIELPEQVSATLPGRTHRKWYRHA